MGLKKEKRTKIIKERKKVDSKIKIKKIIK